MSIQAICSFTTAKNSRADSYWLEKVLPYTLLAIGIIAIVAAEYYLTGISRTLTMAGGCLLIALFIIGKCCCNKEDETKPKVHTQPKPPTLRKPHPLPSKTETTNLKDSKETMPVPHLDVSHFHRSLSTDGISTTSPPLLEASAPPLEVEGLRSLEFVTIDTSRGPKICNQKLKLELEKLKNEISPHDLLQQDELGKLLLDTTYDGVFTLDLHQKGQPGGEWYEAMLIPTGQSPIIWNVTAENLQELNKLKAAFNKAGIKDVSSLVNLVNGKSSYLELV